MPYPHSYLTSDYCFTMTPYSFYQHIKKEKLEDSWWVSVDGEVLDDPMPIADVVAQRPKLEQREVALLHISQAEQKEPRWTSFEYLRIVRPVEAAPSEGFEVLSKRVAELEENYSALLGIKEQFESLAERIALFEQKEAQLAEREVFVAKSEELIFRKMQQIEENRCELEHQNEELEQRINMVS